MTKAEQRRLRKLEIENAELRKAISRHLDVYRDQAMELIDLRARNALVNDVLSDLLHTEAAWTNQPTPSR